VIVLASAPGDVARLRKLIREQRIDLVKVHGLQNPQGAIAARLEGRPIVWVVSSTRVPKAFRRTGTALVDRLASTVLVTGTSLLSAYPGSSNLQARAFAYFPPVDTAAFRPAVRNGRHGLARVLGIQEATRIVGTVANINPQKGIERFLSVAAAVATRNENVHFVIVGRELPSQAEYARDMRRLAGSLDLGPERLTWLGGYSDVSRILPSFDVKLITSVRLSEGIPTTALEAMSCGVVVVSTNVGAIDEAIVHGETGFISRDSDGNDLADYVTQLLDDSGLRHLMGAAGRERALAYFDVEMCADVHLRAYSAAVESVRN
jgi:glycosyltransferase involved in cell wall biosynthesis